MMRIDAGRLTISRLILILIGLALAVPGTALRAAGQPNQDQAFLLPPEKLNDQEIRWTIDAIRDGLYKMQNSKGTWERQFPQADLAHVNAHESGQTTIAILALLASGESYQDQQLQPALDYLLSEKSDYTYVRSLRAHIWAQLPERFEKALTAERTWLLNAYDFNSGSWNYTSIPIPSGYDNSLTQYGVLGLWEAAKRGIDVPDRLWNRVEDHFLRTQLVDGGWNYRPQWGNARGSMTAAGLTCLFVTQDFLHADDYVEIPRKQSPEEDAIRKGLDWLNRNFTAKFHPGGPGDRNEYYFYYYLYGIERVGLASGYRRFADRDWFRTGAAAIIDRMCDPVFDESQRLVGFTLKNQIAKTGNTEVPVVQLSFALMFLSHGRMPIVLSKLRDDEISWNNRPRDAANLTRWISEQVEERRNWQILDMNRPMEEWFDGPLVYLATEQALPYLREYEKAMRERGSEPGNESFTPTRLERLKRYLDLGGLLISNADDHRAGMTDSLREMAAAMYPDFEWRKLPEDHWAYTLNQRVEPRPEVWGLSNGVRELIIHFEPIDAGAVLQANKRSHFEHVFATLSNIYYYASERGRTRPRLEPKLYPGTAEPGQPTVIRRNTPANASRPRITVWRGMYEGNWNPEPAADEMLALRLADHRNVDVRFVDVALDRLRDFRPEEMQGALLWIRGIDAFPTDDATLTGLKNFVDAGGILFIETVGGLGTFGRLAEESFERMYPDARFRRANRHPMITGENLARGEDASRVTYRVFSLDHLGARETRPRIRTMNPRNDEGLPNIFVSRDDLSFALLDQPCWGISGYITRDAEKILGNLIEFARARSQ